MKFSEKFKYAKIGASRIYAGDELIKVNAKEKCAMCDNLTSWASISFLAFYCSEECLDKEWHNYFKAERGLNNN